MSGTAFQMVSTGSLRWESGGAFNDTTDVILSRDAAAVLALKNGATAQEFRVYGTTTGPIYASLFGSGSGGGINVVGNRSIFFQRDGAGVWSIDTGGHFIASTDNSVDIGASGTTRPRTGYFGTAISILGVVSGVGTLALGNGSAPTAQADTVHVYSTDESAGNTIPSFMCEGTAVLATGQADSASSVRVKVRINGTVVTLLAI
jgi:hypothetical protein